MATPSVGTYDVGGWVRTGRTDGLGDWFAATLHLENQNDITIPNTHLYNIKAAAGKYSASLEGHVIDVYPVLTYSEYPTGVFEVETDAGGNVTGGDATIKQSYDDSWYAGWGVQHGQPWPDPEPTIHAIEYRYLAVLWTYVSVDSPFTHTTCYWMSAGTGSVEITDSDPDYGFAHYYAPADGVDLDVTLDVRRLIAGREQSWVKQSLSGGGEWVWNSTEDPEAWIGKLTGKLRIVSDEVANTFIDDGLIVNGTTCRRPSLSTYTWTASKTISSKVGMTSTVTSFGPLSGGYYPWGTPFDDHVSASELTFCEAQIGLTDMNLRLGYDANGDPVDYTAYTNSTETCSAEGIDDTLTYRATAGGDGYIKAEWTNLGLSVQYTGGVKCADGSAVDPDPELSDGTHAWTGPTSPVFVYSGTWTLITRDLAGTTTMANKSPSSGDDYHAGPPWYWGRSDNAPSELSIRLANAADYADCEYMDGDTLKTDSRVLFQYPRDQVGMTFSGAGYLLDALDTTGASGIGGWAGVNCTLGVSGGKLVATSVGADAYIYRADYIIDSDPYRPAHWPMYRFCEVNASRVPSKLTVKRTQGQDTFEKNFSHCKRTLASGIYTCRYDTCKPAGIVTAADVTQSGITQMQPERSEYGAPYMELSDMSWSWGITGFDRIEIHLTEDVNYTFENIECAAASGAGYQAVGVEVEREYMPGGYDPGSILLSHDDETYISQVLWRQAAIWANGKLCAEIPATRRQDTPSVTTWKNYSLKDAFITQIEASVTTRNSWFLFPPDTFASWGFTSPIGDYDSDWWDATNSCYLTEQVYGAQDVCPTGFMEDNDGGYGSAGPRDPTTSIRVRPVYDAVLNGEDSSLPWFGDGLDREIRHTKAILRFQLRVRSRVAGVAWVMSEAPDESTPVVDFQFPISCVAADIDPETVTTDSAGFFRSLEHRDSALVKMAHSTNLALYNRVISRICDILPGFGMSVDYEPACRTYVVYTTPNGSYLRITSNYGATWSTPIFICEESQPTITARWATGYQRLCVVTKSSGTLYLRTSDDEGDTWSAPVSLWAGTHPHLFREPATDLKLLYWYSGGTIYVRRSADNCATWIETAQACVADASDDAFVVFAAGDAANRIGLIYTDTGGTIQCVFSQANGLPSYA